MSNSQDFYRAFEDKYRGTRASIKERLMVYRPFLKPLLELNPKARAIDLGCGRGEWLELAGELGFEAVGVDLNAGMLAAAKANGFEVEQADVIEFLERQPEASALVVSGFHIAEHLPFEVLQTLVHQAHRVLVPGGLLILETPNPENVTVGANSFYLDPTHERPLPPSLLSFLPEYYGFMRTSILRLQESETVREGGPDLRLLDVFEGVSPDYAVVAQKEGSERAMALLKQEFSKNYGVNLASLAERYEARINHILAQAVEHAELATEKAAQAQASASQYEQKALEAAVELAKVHHSRSWRVTRPLRWVSIQVALLQQHGVTERIKALVRKIASPVLAFLIAFLSSKPELRRLCIAAAQKLGIYSRLRRFYIGGAESRSYTSSLNDLSPEAQETYHKLRKAVCTKRKHM